MKRKLFVLLMMSWVVAVTATVAAAEEMVTIPKSRLRELEQKEKELDAIKGELGRARGEKEKLQREKESAEAGRAEAEREKLRLMEAKAAAEARAVAASAEPVVQRDTPPLATLPPLKKGEVVESLDLINHYRTDAAGAAKRYEKRKLRVRGVVVGFEKPIFLSHYLIVLQSTDRRWRVECSVDIPPELRSAYPIKHGEALAGELRSGARVTLARLGQTATIDAYCRGLKEQSLILSGGVLLSAE